MKEQELSFSKYKNSIHLLYLFLELISLESDINKWSKKYFKNNDPRLFRYLQLEALFSAFEISSEVKDFKRGAFLEDEKERIIFNMLLDYRIKLVSPLSFLDGLYAISDNQIDTLKKIVDLNAFIIHEVKSIDNILIKYIAINDKQISKRNLIDNYNYPDVDIKEIDYFNM